MLAFVVQKVGDALNEERKAVNGGRVLILGVAYKKDIDDLRESPALEIIEQLQQRGTDVLYHDPYCLEIADDGHTPIQGLPLHSVELSDALLHVVDCVVVITDHSDVDYARVRRHASLIVDTRGVMRGVPGKGKVVGLSGQEQNGDEAPVKHSRVPVLQAV